MASDRFEVFKYFDVEDAEAITMHLSEILNRYRWQTTQDPVAGLLPDMVDIAYLNFGAPPRRMDMFEVGELIQRALNSRKSSVFLMQLSINSIEEIWKVAVGNAFVPQVVFELRSLSTANDELYLAGFEPAHLEIMNNHWLQLLEMGTVDLLRRNFHSWSCPFYVYIRRKVRRIAGSLFFKDLFRVSSNSDNFLHRLRILLGIDERISNIQVFSGPQEERLVKKFDRLLLHHRDPSQVNRLFDSVGYSLKDWVKARACYAL